MGDAIEAVILRGRTSPFKRLFMKRRVVAREEEEGRRRAGKRDGARAEGDGVWMKSRSWTESRGVGLCARAMCGRDGDAND